MMVRNKEFNVMKKIRITDAVACVFWRAFS